MLTLLNQQFAIENKVKFCHGVNEQPCVRIQSPWSQAEIYLHGAHLTSFKRDQQGEAIWLSPLALYQKDKAIRGGIPICWPWFGKSQYSAELPQHGFARTSLFKVSQVSELANHSIRLVLELNDCERSRSLWPYQFKLEVIFIIGAELSVELKTTNCDIQPFKISQAIHSYIQLETIANTSLTGLDTCKYYDQLTGENKKQTGELKFSQETDSIYYTGDQGFVIKQNSQSGNRDIKITQQFADSTIVWNPWINKSKNMSDFPDDGYLTMLCVEAANTGRDINLFPGENYSLMQIIK